MSERVCARCGRKPPLGFASVTFGSSERWYCHEGPSPTCYEQVTFTRSTPVVPDDGLERCIHGMTWREACDQCHQDQSAGQP